MNIPEKVKEKELIWKTSLIRSEFLKIYFDEMGVNEEVSIDRLTNLYDCFKDNNNNKFLFAIVRVNENSENIKKALDTEVKEGTSFRMLENTEWLAACNLADKWSDVTTVCYCKMWRTVFFVE